MGYFLLMLLTLLSFAGCQQQSEPDEMIQKQEPPPPYLRIPLDGIVSTIDPGLTLDLASIELVEQLFLGLTDFDPETYDAVPELATHWQISPDGQEYTFFLRQDVKWTDGTPVTAHDIVWAVQRNIAPETQSPGIQTLHILKNAEVLSQSDSYGEPVTPLGVTALDDYTVKFTLEHPAAYFPALAGLWTYRPLPRKTIERYQDKWTEPQYIQTNGSYQLAEWHRGNKLVLRKNPHYYDSEKVAIAELHYYIVPESSLGLAMYEQDELDIIGGQTYLRLPLTEIPRIELDPVLRKELQVIPQFCTESYLFNTQKPPMDNVLVRKAIATAINKQLLIDVVIKGNHIPASTFTRPPVFGSVAPEAGVGTFYNPKEAKTWLAAAGYPDGAGFPKIVIMHNSSEFHHNLAEGIKTILAYHLNIESIEIREANFELYWETISDPTQAPHMFRLGWCSDYPDANNWLYEVFHPTKGINLVGWNNQEFATLVEQAQQVIEHDKRKQLYQRAEQILTEESVVIVPLYFANEPILVKPRLKQWYGMAFGGQHVRDWQLRK